jgi:hypothetical protein
VTAETAAFLLSILERVTLRVGDDDFEANANASAKAKRELRQIVAVGAD